jgi:carbon storage regulator
MLNLRRRPGQSIKIGDNVHVWIKGVIGDQVLVGIDAPHEISILRDDAKLKQPRDYAAGDTTALP